MSLRHLAVFLASFLTFTLELMVSKALLPRFGGTAYVWTTCVLFFQAAMVASVALCQKLPALGPARAAKAHLALLLLGASFFPFSLAGEQGPLVVSLLSTLFSSIGAAFFALSMSTVLLQGEMMAAKGREPYTLYAASNAGALGALLAYPVILEPALSLRRQFFYWYALYLSLIALRAALAPTDGETRPAPAPARVGWSDRLLWTALAAGPSLALLAATNFLAFNVASIPLLWALPLGLYLLTFILAFRSERNLPTALYGLLLIGVLLLLAPGALIGLRKTSLGSAYQMMLSLMVATGMALNLLGLFVFSLICHKSLATRKPAAEGAMPAFYLCIAVGGCLGGLVSAALPILASKRASTSLEWSLAAGLCIAAVLFRDREKLSALWRASGRAVKAVAVAVLLVAVPGFAYFSLNGPPSAKQTLFELRNFYGIHRVTQLFTYRQLFHGNTIHGMQHIDRFMSPYPLGYYHPNSPLGHVFDRFGPRFKSIGAIGLGAGSVAAFGRPGQRIEFFELDPDVGMIANTYFTFLKESKAAVHVTYGDARLSLEKWEGVFDFLILDAFSSDSVPVHLLTAEALAVYLRRLAPNGMIAFHISSRVVDIKPVIARLAQHFELHAAVRSTLRSDLDEDEYSSTWVILSRDLEGAAWLVQNKEWRWLLPKRPGWPRLWTDDYASLFGLFRL